tara:strand:- start:516 stop:1517 length:1002 start_codon:yes stop_codon:yes gene_type:complete
MGEVLTNSQIGGRRNIIINGAMNVAQRATSATGLGASSGYHVVDRVNFGHSGNSAGRYTATQEAITDLGGFNNALKLACTTADTSIASNEWERLVFNLEAQDLQSLKFGTSDAEKFTVSFYVKGNASATYTLGAQSADSNRWMAKTFDVTTSFTRVSLTFEADTVGAINNDNGHGIILYITLQAGSDRTSGSIPSTWETLSAGDTADSNQTQFFDSTSRTLFITGLQMEVGSVATPFEHRSFGEEFSLCSRYYEVAEGYGSAYHYSVNTNSNDRFDATATYKVEKRATPTLTVTNNGGGSISNYSNTTKKATYRRTGAFSGPNAFSVAGDAEL